MGLLPTAAALALVLLLVLVGVIAALRIRSLRQWWLTLRFPGECLWNALLYYRDRGHPTAVPGFRYHSIFWTPIQWLPLSGLDSYLVLVTERDPHLGQTTLAYLADSHQQWAVQAAQIELDIRTVEQCTTIADVRLLHHKTPFLTHPSTPTQDHTRLATMVLLRLSRMSAEVDSALDLRHRYYQRRALRTAHEQLDQILRETMREGSRMAVRLQPVLQQWRTVLIQTLEQLDHALHHQQDIESPYIFGVPLRTDQPVFVGRTTLATHIEQLLRDPRSPPIFLYGQRRMGKTSLLYQLYRLLPPALLPLLIDGQSLMVADDLGTFLARIAGQMTHAARQWRHLTLPSPDRTRLRHHPARIFHTWLDTVEHWLDQEQIEQVVLCFDEFNLIDHLLAHRSDIATDLFALFRHLIQYRRRFRVVLVSSLSLQELQRWAGPLLNVQVLKVACLTDRETRQLIEHPVDQFPLQYTPDATHRIVQLTAGHPAYVQLLCDEIVHLKNTQPMATRYLVELADVETATSRSLHTGAMLFTDLIAQIGAGATPLLQAIAMYGPRAGVTRPMLREHTPAPLEPVLQVLLRRDIIMATDTGYQFQIELVRRWFAQTHGTHATD